MFCSTAPPDTPTITADDEDKVDGDDVELTCASTTSDVDTYEFFKDGTSLGAASATATFTISGATIDDTDGYTCKATKDDIPSEGSPDADIDCEFILLLYFGVY